MSCNSLSTARSDDLTTLVIDVQPYFLDGWTAGTNESLIARLKHLFGLAIANDLPCLATFEQPVEKKGWLPVTLGAAFPADGQKFTKNTFNCCGEPNIREALRSIGRSQFAVAGGETDVCVLQSVSGLLENGYQVFLLEDCLFSNEPQVGPAIRRMERAGAIPTMVKTLAYELRQSMRNPSEQTGQVEAKECGIAGGRTGRTSRLESELRSLRMNRATALLVLIDFDVVLLRGCLDAVLH